MVIFHFAKCSSTISQRKIVEKTRDPKHTRLSECFGPMPDKPAKVSGRAPQPVHQWLQIVGEAKFDSSLSWCVQITPISLWFMIRK